MKRGALLVSAAAVLIASFADRTVRADEAAPAEVVRFRAVAIELVVGDEGLAAYQVELLVRTGDASIVGVEGGTAAGFSAPPYYDPAALYAGRIVLAAFNTKVRLKKGRHRVAVVHLREAGPSPAYALEVVAAAAADGSRVHVRAVLVDVKGVKP
jgi:hypothetical protein